MGDRGRSGVSLISLWALQSEAAAVDKRCQPMHTPEAILFASFDSSTALVASTIMRNSQSGSKHPTGIVKSRSTEAPGNRGGVGLSTDPWLPKSTRVTEAPAGAEP